MHPPTFWIRVFLGMILLSNTVPTQIVNASSLQKKNSITRNELFIIGSTDNEITLQLNTIDYVILPQTDINHQCNYIYAHGLESGNIPGYPLLPFKGATIGIPLNANPSITILSVDQQPISGSYLICPEKTPHFTISPDNIPQHDEETLEYDPIVYQKKSWYPESIVEITSEGFIRSQRVAQIRISPFQYNPVTRELRYYPRLSISVNFNNDSKSARLAPSGRIDEGDFEAILANNLVNYELSSNWRILRPPQAIQKVASPETNPSLFKFVLNKTGFYNVSYDELVNAGLEPASIDPRKFELITGGKPVAIEVKGEDDGSFDPGDSIIFYGWSIESKYTSHNVYYLTLGKEYGKRIPKVQGAPSGEAQSPTSFRYTQHFEKNMLYFSYAPSKLDNDTFYWDYFYATKTPVSKVYEFQLSQISPEAQDISLSGSIRGYKATPKHATRIYLNNRLVLDTTWPRGTQLDFNVTLDKSYTQEGTNTLKIELPLGNNITEDYQLLNWIDITYSRTFNVDNNLIKFTGTPGKPQEYILTGFASSDTQTYDITNPFTPTFITGIEVVGMSYPNEVHFEQSTTLPHDYLALTTDQFLHPLRILSDEPSDLKNHNNAADYIIITHPEFYTEVLPLADWRTMQGLRTTVVKVDDIYDEFNHGIEDAEAIKEFLTYVYNNWQAPAPTYVLLVGDGNYDGNNYLGANDNNFIPPNLKNVDFWLGETASDNQYVTISGDDNLPDMAIGRLTVRTGKEAEMVVSKIINYELGYITDGWNTHTIIIADNQDSSGNFSFYADRIANEYIPSNYEINKIYFGITHLMVEDARAEIVNQINRGSLLVNYIGHGSVQGLAAELLFQNSTITQLNNQARLPIVATMSCLTGYFHHPISVSTNNTALSEILVNTPDKGAIAVWSSTGLGVASGQDYLNRGLHTAILSDKIRRLGAATTAAKYYLFSNTIYYRDLLDTYTLFGDPATLINTNMKASFLPLVIHN